MNELLKANPDYDWHKQVTFRGTIRKAFLFLEQDYPCWEAINEIFYDDGYWIKELNCNHRFNADIAHMMMSIENRQKRILIITKDVALLHYKGDLPLRPDNIFFQAKGKIRRMDRCTDRMLREGNDLFRLYIAGEFEE